MGFVYEKIDFLLTISLGMLLTSAITLLIPWITRADLLILAFGVNQIPFGAFEVGGNMMAKRLWSVSSSPSSLTRVTRVMQGLQFAYGIGGLAAAAAAVALPPSEQDEVPVYSRRATTHLLYPYSLISLLVLVNAVLTCVVGHAFPDSPASIANWRNGCRCCSTQAADAPATASVSRFWKGVCILLSLAFLFVYLGLEISFTGFLTPFVLRMPALHMDRRSGAHLTALFFATFTLFRLATMAYISRIGNEGNLASCLTLVTTSSLLLLTLGSESRTALWAAVAAAGTGVSSIWASLFGFLEERIPLSPLVSGLMVASGAAAEFVFPFLLSSFMQEHPSVLPWTVFSCSLAISLLFALLSFVCRHKLKQR